MTDWCPQCPNRHLANICERLGDDVTAAEIREAGCNNWKQIQHDIKDKNTGQLIEKKTIGACMRDHLPGWFNQVNSLCSEVSQTAQSSRNETARGLENVARAVLVGGPEGLVKMIGGGGDDST